MSGKRGTRDRGESSRAAAPGVATLGGAVRVLAEFGLPIAAYYLSRAVGIQIFPALVVGAVVSVLIAAEPLLRHRRPDGAAALMASLMLVSVAVSLWAGSVRLLLAREAVLTGVTGIWFLVTARKQRPLVYRLSLPLLQGRFRWPPHWESVWQRAPRFRRMWQISSVMWGVGTLADSALRVVMAYTLPPDLVPALGTVLYVATSAVLIIATNVFYAVSGAYNPDSTLYQTHGTATDTSRTAPGR